MSSKSARKRMAAGNESRIPKIVDTKPKDDYKKKKHDGSRCPKCGKGIEGKDSLCDFHWKEYLGTHIGGRGSDFDREREVH